jgi:hypothetical protein
MYREDQLICSRFCNTENGQKLNAIFETLAIALFKDFHPDRCWSTSSHQLRQRFRQMAQGNEPLPTTQKD